MKIRNKRLMTMLVATFAVVFLAGSAFAFRADGPLSFAGTANIDARLQLSIVEYEFAFDRYSDDVEIVTALGEGVRNVEFTMEFTRPARRSVDFYVENTGTMPAQLHAANIINDFSELTGIPADGIENDIVFYIWRDGNAMDFRADQQLNNMPVIEVGETFMVRVIVDFMGGPYLNPPRIIDTHFLYGEVVSTLNLDYGLPR